MADVAKLPSIADQPVEIPKNEDPADESKELRQQVQQNVPTNSHHHDSEYDTASDLEGGEEDDYDEEDSIGVEGDEDDVESDGSIVFDLERQRGDGQETDYTKKVDEDRSNPQYIPKKGTFYEHDDRTADDPEGNESIRDDGGEGETTKSSTPTISASSKTMKKWLPASAVDRWSHDRYDENEQAPKSRAELVSAYGYDIRNEDGPPRARRRRRYGRGPTKYVRNWEDETAYMKSSNTQRKPRPEDFPALGDRKGRKSRNFREEKENRHERHGERSSGAHRSGGSNSHRDNKSERSSGKSFRSGRQSMDFKNQTKSRLSNDTQNRIPPNRQNEKIDNIRQAVEESKPQVETVSFTNTKVISTSQNDRYNSHEGVHINQISGHRELKDKITTINTSNIINSRHSPQANQLTSRLQIQSRNDPSHVGSVQMHSLVSQNQADLQQSAETNRSKRYSSLRQRTQNDNVVSSQAAQMDQHSLQQIQLHDHHQQQPQTQHVLLQDQHLLQANLMQLYHTQENIQAQMQGVTIQSLPTGHQAKPQYQNVQQTYQPTAPGAPTYFAPAGDFTAAPTPAAPQTQYSQQQPAAFIQQQPTAPQMGFNTQAQPSGPPASQPIPTALNYVQAPQNPTPPAPYQNFSGFPNYNTVNTVGGTTYFVPQQQPPPRPVVIPQRRPTNAIPILAPPSEKNKQKLLLEKDDEGKTPSASTAANAPIGSAENIDHILDNMFVQRPPYQPPTRKSSSPATESVGTSTTSVNEDKASINMPGAAINETSGVQNRLEEAVKSLSIEDPKPLGNIEHQMQSTHSTIAPTTSTPEIPSHETG